VAFNPNGNGNGVRGRGRFQGGGMLSEINVTPFVDVLLVLLIIFMLTAHVMESGIEVDVPAVKTTKDTTKDLPIVSITKEGEFYLGEKPINIHELATAVQKRYGKVQTVYVRADKQMQWDTIAQVLAELGAAKIGVSVVTKPEDITRRRH
jgi:biopolymer transport protein ExbD